ncbi:uncharacterized protein LOC133891937 [Phragmites australis]|uniref:uncharacterized protein LOC133891937 n=1 Tax=Phragmites australis TaxID=29695 RepID=UPI002D7828AA|nr:uncharacterized protein LOC133891937 [Phragmites australis]
MREMMFCGTGSFKDVDKEEAGGGAGAKAKPAKSKKGKGNPYASRGLDKFSTVLSELESRREKILRRVGSDVDADHLMVRFVQSEAKGWVSIVVKLPQEEQQATDAKSEAKKSKQATKPTTRPMTPPTEPGSPKEDAAKLVPPAAKAAPAKKSKAGGERWSWSWGRKVRPHRYWLLAMALLLLSLVVFGRVFAICCTSIWWYLLPILKSEEGQVATRTPAAKACKDLGKAGDKLAAVAPPLPPSHGKKSSSGAAHEVVSPRSHAHRKKG